MEFNEEELAMMQKQINDNATDKNLTKQERYAHAKAATEATITEAKRDASVTNATPLIEEQLAAVNKNTPAWLWHSFDGKKSKIETNLKFAEFRDDLSETHPIIVGTERYAVGVHFNGKYWREYKKDSEASKDISSTTMRMLGDYGLVESLPSGNITKLSTFNSSYILEPNEHIDFDDPNLVNFQNGTLNLEEMKVHEYRKEDYLTRMLPVEVRESVDGGLVAEYAHYLLGDEEKTLSEWFGYMMFADATTLNYLVFMTGVGGNGKSTLLNTLLSAFGEYGSSVTFSQLSDDSKAGQYLDNLAHSYANILTEPDTKMNDQALTMLKKLSAGDPLQANPKYRSPYMFQNRAKFLISANSDLPTFPDTEEYHRRLVLLNASAPALRSLPDDKAMDVKTKYAPAKLREALPEYIYYSIGLAKTAIANKRLTLLPSTQARVTNWLQGNDLISEFTHETLKPITGTNGVTLKYLYEHFKSFYADVVGDDHVINMTQFKKELTKKGYEFEMSARKGAEHDAQLVDDWNVNKRNRLKGYGMEQVNLNLTIGAM